MGVSFSERVRVAPDVLFRLVGEEGVLLNLQYRNVPGSEPRGDSNVERPWYAPARYRRPTTNCFRSTTWNPRSCARTSRNSSIQLLAQKLIEAGPRTEERRGAT